MSSPVEYESGDFETDTETEQSESESEYETDCSRYTPSATPESEDYSSCESSSLETPSETDESIACSENLSEEIWSD